MFLPTCDVAKAMGVTKAHKACVEHKAVDVHKKAFDDLSATERLMSLKSLRSGSSLAFSLPTHLLPMTGSDEQLEDDCAKVQDT